MTSTIKVDTISEYSSGNGVAIDGLTIKDGGITATTGATVFNEASADVDFRVESNNESSMLHVNAGTDTVLIGTDTTDDGWFDADGSYVPGFMTFGNGNTDGRLSAFVNNQADAGGPLVCLGKTRATAPETYTIVQDDDQLGVISFQGGDGTTFVEGASIRADVDGTPGGNDMPGRLEFYTTADGGNSGTERMRISSSGQTQISSAINDVLFYVKNTATSGNVYGQQIQYSSTVNDTGNYFFRCLGNNNSTVRAAIYSNGDFDSATNSYGATSDERIKQNITDANSQWDDIKALKVRNFKFKDDVRTEDAGGQAANTYLGLVAQEVESVSPGLIKAKNPEKADIISSSEFGTLYTKDDAETKDGNDAVLYTSGDDEVKNGSAKVGDIKTEATHSKEIGDIKSTTGEKVKKVSYSVLYMKAIKALQEAMTRIETLEAEVTALKGE